MSDEGILLKFIVGQRVVKQDEDSRFEGEDRTVTNWDGMRT
jgi:hypothetical protein